MKSKSHSQVNWAQGRLGMLWNWNTLNRKSAEVFEPQERAKREGGRVEIATTKGDSNLTKCKLFLASKHCNQRRRGGIKAGKCVVWVPGNVFGLQ